MFIEFGCNALPKKTFAEAIATNNDIVVGLKNNQEVLLVDCKIKAESQVPIDVYVEENKANHGRTEIRKVEKYELMLRSLHLCLYTGEFPKSSFECFRYILALS